MPAPAQRRLVFHRQSRSALRRYRRLSLRNGHGYTPVPPGAARPGQAQRPRRCHSSFSSDQEAYRERPETDGLVGRIDVEADGLLCHVCIFLANGVYRATTTKGNSLLGRVRPPDTLSSASAVERISVVGQLIVVQPPNSLLIVQVSDFPVVGTLP